MPLNRGMDTINIDLDTFTPDLREQYNEFTMLFVGAVKINNELREFLTLPSDLGRKIIARVGPERMDLERIITGLYPETTFVDYMDEHELAKLMANADVFVSPPSLLAMLEANACGTPVAAYPSFQFGDHIVDHLNGVQDEDLAIAVVNAATLDRNKIREYTEEL